MKKVHAIEVYDALGQGWTRQPYKRTPEAVAEMAASQDDRRRSVRVIAGTAEMVEDSEVDSDGRCKKASNS